MAFLFSLPFKRIHTLTTTNPCILHRCLLSTSNSGGSDNLISKQPSPSNPGGSETPLDVSLITFMRNYWGEQFQEKLKQITLMRNHHGEQLHKKWKQFEANSESLKAKYSEAVQLASEFNESRKASLNQIIENVSEYRGLIEDMDRLAFRDQGERNMLDDEGNKLCMKVMYLMGNTTRGVKLLGVLSYSRVIFYDEMIKTLSEIRKEWTILKDFSSLHEDLRKVKWNYNNNEEELNEELWNELNEKLGNISWNELRLELMDCREMDLFDLKLLAKEADHQQAYLNEMYDELSVIYNYLDNSLSCSGGF